MGCLQSCLPCQYCTANSSPQEGYLQPADAGLAGTQRAELQHCATRHHWFVKPATPLEVFQALEPGGSLAIALKVCLCPDTHSGLPTTFLLKSPSFGVAQRVPGAPLKCPRDTIPELLLSWWPHSLRVHTGLTSPPCPGS